MLILRQLLFRIERRHLDRDLDAPVAAAYGWPADIADDDALARLLALNQARSAENSQEKRTGDAGRAATP